LYEGDTRKKWRGCRTVILPDFQGLGIGVRFSDAIADIHIEDGYRYFSKTAHMRMGEYRQHSPIVESYFYQFG
jgi:GNAT superfamily N-acetyltransferase